MSRTFAAAEKETVMANDNAKPQSALLSLSLSSPTLFSNLSGKLPIRPSVCHRILLIGLLIAFSNSKGPFLSVEAAFHRRERVRGATKIRPVAIVLPDSWTVSRLLKDNNGNNADKTTPSPVQKASEDKTKTTPQPTAARQDQDKTTESPTVSPTVKATNGAPTKTPTQSPTVKAVPQKETPAPATPTKTSLQTCQDATTCEECYVATLAVHKKHEGEKICRWLPKEDDDDDDDDDDASKYTCQYKDAEGTNILTMCDAPKAAPSKTPQPTVKATPSPSSEPTTTKTKTKTTLEPTAKATPSPSSEPTTTKTSTKTTPEPTPKAKATPSPTAKTNPDNGPDTTTKAPTAAPTPTKASRDDDFEDFSEGGLLDDFGAREVAGITFCVMLFILWMRCCRNRTGVPPKQSFARTPSNDAKYQGVSTVDDDNASDDWGWDDDNMNMDTGGSSGDLEMSNNVRQQSSSPTAATTTTRPVQPRAGISLQPKKTPAPSPPRSDIFSEMGLAVTQPNFSKKKGGVKRLGAVPLPKDDDPWGTNDDDLDDLLNDS